MSPNVNINRNHFPSCPICKAAGRPNKHFLSKCTYIPTEDKKYLVKARQISEVYDVPLDSDEDDSMNTHQSEPISLGPDPKHAESLNANLVQIEQSPNLDVFHGNDTVKLTIDSGATGNMMRTSCAHYLGIKISKGSQAVRQADRLFHLKVVGEVRTVFVFDKHKIYFEGLAVENLDVDVLNVDVLDVDVNLQSS